MKQLLILALVLISLCCMTMARSEQEYDVGNDLVARDFHQRELMECIFRSRESRGIFKTNNFSSGQNQM